MTLIARVRRTIVERSLIVRGQRVLCACSGGPDSAALLFALSRLGPELGFSLAVASVDHGLRSQAHADVAIAERQATAVGVEFHALHVRVSAGSSVQARAREARYEALKELATRLSATRVATGHTQDDQAETVLSRLLRGSGVAGLSGVDPCRPDGVIRPLIDCSRSEVRCFAREHAEAIASDPSNQDERFERVRIRTHLLPVLRAEDSTLEQHLADLADDARGYTQLIELLAAELVRAAQLDPKTLQISALITQPSVLRRSAFRLWLRRTLGQVPGRAELMQLDASVSRRGGEVWLRNGYCVRVEQGDRLCLRARTQGNS